MGPGGPREGGGAQGRGAQLTEYQALLATKERDPIPHDLKVVDKLLKEHQVGLPCGVWVGLGRGRGRPMGRGPVEGGAWGGGGRGGPPGQQEEGPPPHTTSRWSTSSSRNTRWAVGFSCVELGVWVDGGEGGGGLGREDSPGHQGARPHPA